MHESKKYQESRDLIAIAVEEALMKMGRSELETVQERLKADYGITIKDSLDNPEYLKSTLCGMFGNAYQDILNTIDEIVVDSKDEEIVKGFLYVMKS